MSEPGRPDRYNPEDEVESLSSKLKLANAEAEKWKSAAEHATKEADKFAMRLHDVEARWELCGEKRRAIEAYADELRIVNHDLADVLRALEWSKVNAGDAPVCPWCEAAKPAHERLCKLKSMIDKGYIQKGGPDPVKAIFAAMGYVVRDQPEGARSLELDHQRGVCDEKTCGYCKAYKKGGGL